MRGSDHPIFRQRAQSVLLLAVFTAVGCTSGTESDPSSSLHLRIPETEDPCRVFDEEEIASSLNVAPGATLKLGPFHDNIPVFLDLPGIIVCKFTASWSGIETRLYFGLIPGLGRHALDSWKGSRKPVRVPRIEQEAWWAPPELAVLSDNKVLALSFSHSNVPKRTQLLRAKRILSSLRHR